MQKIRIKGNKRLAGTINASSAKNSVLKLMAASLLSSSPCYIRNVPDIDDVHILIELLRYLGCDVNLDGRKVLRIVPSIERFEAPYELVNRMRASIVVLGPLVARYGRARVSLPGGCNIGRRKIDLHLTGIASLGADINIEEGFIVATANKLKGTIVNLHFPSVGATENLIMAAVLAEGETVIENAAREPEISDFCEMLKKMGADIEGDGTSTIRIKGVKELKGTEHKPIPDRIEVGTFILAGVMTYGRLKVRGIREDHLDMFLEKLSEAGGEFSIRNSTIEVNQRSELEGVDIATLPYPGFPTDLQAPMMAALSIANGVSVITENVFENRFLHADELVRMGAKIDVQGRHAILRGVKELTGVPVKAMDLRGGAALCLAGLAANGETTVERAEHIFRGYEAFVEKLEAVGAEISLNEEESDEDYPIGD